VVAWRARDASAGPGVADAARAFAASVGSRLDATEGLTLRWLGGGTDARMVWAGLALDATEPALDDLPARVSAAVAGVGGARIAEAVREGERERARSVAYPAVAASRLATRRLDGEAAGDRPAAGQLLRALSRAEPRYVVGRPEE